MGFLSEAGMQAMLGSRGDNRAASRVSPEMSLGDFWGWCGWTMAGGGLLVLLPALTPVAHHNPSPCVGSEMGKIGRFVPQQPFHPLGHAAANGTCNRTLENDLSSPPCTGSEETRNYSLEENSC